MTKNINNILKYGSCFLIFLLPIFDIGNMYFSYPSSKTFLFFGFVEILAAFWIYALVVDPSYRLSKRIILYFLPLVLYITWMTIAGILAVNPHFSLWSSLDRETGLLTLYHSLVLALIIASLVKKNGIIYLHKFMQWFLNGSFVLAISLYLGNEALNFNFLKDSAGGGLMGNSSLAAAYLMFALAFGFFLLFSKNINKNKKWWTIVKMTVILFSPLFVNIYGLFTGNGLLGSARGATLGLIVSFLVAGVWYLFISKKKTFRVLGALGIVIGLVIFSIGWMQLINPNTKLHQKFMETASGTRFIFDDISHKSITQHPWFGYGPENYPIAFQKNFNPIMASSAYNHEGWNDRAHNIYYDTGVSGGYPAIVFYTLFILSILYVLYKLRKIEIFNHWQISILAGLIIGYIFQNLFVFDSLFSLVALFSLAGIIFACEDSLIKEKYLAKPVNLFVKNTLIIFLVFACSISLIFFVFRPAKKAFAYYSVIHMPIDVRGEHYNDLLGGSFMGDDWDTSGMAFDIYAYYQSNSVDIKNNKTLLPYAESDIKGLLQYLETIAEKNKTDARLDISIISLYNALNYFSDNPYDPTLGAHLFSIIDHIETLTPKNPQIYWARALVYTWKRDPQGIVNTYEKGIANDPSFPDFHQLLINFAKATGNQKLYNDSLLQAQKDIPGFVLSQ